MLYFAYGSNMDRQQMRLRCPGSSLLGAASFPGGEIRFAGHSESWGGAVATIGARSGGSVPGLLYHVSRRNVDALDACEGHPYSYRRVVVSVRVDSDRGVVRHVKAATYVMVRAGSDGSPSDSYYRQIEDAYVAHGFDVVPLREARDRAPARSRVFVYGSLLSGLHNHGVLRGARFDGCAATPPRYTMVDMGAYPGVVAGGHGRIVGEVYEVDASTLARLDQLEGHPRFYRREVIRLGDGSEAWAYLIPHARVRGSDRVPSGDWRRAVSEWKRGGWR